MKKVIFTFASCVAMFAATLVNAQTATEFNVVGDAFVTVPNISDTDLANGIEPTFLFFGGNESVANGNVGFGTDGLQGTGGFNNGGFNVGNGNGLALYTIDLGSAQAIDSVNIFTQTPNTAGSNRQDFDLLIFGHNETLAFNPDFGFTGDDIVFNDPALDSFAAIQADAITTPLTTIGTVNAQNPGTTFFGASSTLANNQEFQFISILADAQGTAGGGGESTIFTEIDVIQGVAVPEPSSALLIGLAGTVLLVRRRRK